LGKWNHFSRLASTDLTTQYSVPIFAIGQAVAYQRYLMRDSNSSIGLVPTLTLQELWLMFSFISATIPCMRSFLNAFQSLNFAVTSPTNTKHTTHTGSQGIALESLKRTFHSAEAMNGMHRVPSTSTSFRPGTSSYGVEIRHEEPGLGEEGASIASDGSERMIIRRDTQIRVEQESMKDIDLQGMGGFGRAR
jgi:hypothetical protein